MCGITGWVDFSRDMTREREVIDAMTETMACRGPDASGVWSDRNVALGHRRLAVIDIPGGAQPMSVSTPDGDVVMVYSGEAYNFEELREELIQAGQKFETASDTEVVLRGYLHWGDALADRLNGMYAFAIWDSRVRKLVMIRDRMGIKPFYFYRTAHGVLFGSEPKAILANPLAECVVDLNGLREMLVPVKTPSLGTRFGRACRRWCPAPLSPLTSAACVNVPIGGWSPGCTLGTGRRLLRGCARCLTTSSAVSWSPTCPNACCCLAAWTPARSRRCPHAS